MFDGPFGAYVHVPFCELICPFCPYNKVRADESLAQRYFAALAGEIDAYVSLRGRGSDGAFTSLYVGGGTPTLYPGELARVIERVPVTGEVAVEVLPTHGTPTRLQDLADMGVTAVSIGAQSFHDPVLRRLGRPHDAEAARAATENAMRRFDCVDVDLIVDVAWDDDAACASAFRDDVGTCFDIGVDQVSTYPLMRFGYTPFGSARHDRRREHQILSEVSALAADKGYERRSVWTFNKRGAPAYTSITRRRFLGMGAGSSSFAGQDFLVNHFGIDAYVSAVERGDIPVARWIELGRWAGSAYDAFWQAYAGGVDLRHLRDAYGAVAANVLHAGFAPMAALGILQRVPGGYRLTHRGFDVYHDLERLVTYQLIEPLWGQMLREHEQTCPVEVAGARWADPSASRRGRMWGLVSGRYEVPIAGPVPTVPHLNALGEVEVGERAHQ